MGRTTRFLVVLLVAVVVASLAAYAVYIAIQKMPRQASTDTTPVVVAARPIALGALLTRDDVKVAAWPVKTLVPGGFDSVDKVLDRGAIRAISENEPITESRIAEKGMGAGLPPTIPAGMRAISVRVNDVIGVAGFVVPGTFVDVVVTVRGGGETAQTMSRVVVNNVQVLTSGTRYDQDQAQRDGKPIETSVVTLLVTPSDAERIALAGNEGKITLTLRNPLDQVPSGTAGVRMASLMGAPDPPQPVAPKVPTRPVVRAPVPAPVPPPTPKPYTVETIRGAKRTEEVIR